MASSGCLRPFQSRVSAGSFGLVRVVAASAPSTLATAYKFRLRLEDYEKIVEWLEVPENFQQVVGGGRRTRIGGKYQSKATVFKQMQVVLQANDFPKEISAANLGKRFDRYVSKFKQAQEVKTSTGGGLSEEEMAAGMILEDKLNKICPHFSRMEALYGGRPNVSPIVLGDHGFDLDHDYLNPNGAIVDDDLQRAEPGDENDFLPLEEDTYTTHVNSFPDENLSPSIDTPHTFVPRSRLDERVLTDDTDFWCNIEKIAQDNGARENFCNGDHSNKTIELSANTVPVRGVNGKDSSVPAPAASGVGGNLGANAAIGVDARELAHGARGKDARGPPKAPLAPTKKLANKADVVANEKHATSKPNMAAIYSERLNLKGEYRKELIETRDRWKTVDLEERREARLQARQLALRTAKAQQQHEISMEAKTVANECKKAKLDSEIPVAKSNLDIEHRMLMAKVDRCIALLLEMVHSTKTHDELLELINLASVD